MFKQRQLILDGTPKRQITYRTEDAPSSCSVNTSGGALSAIEIALHFTNAKDGVQSTPPPIERSLTKGECLTFQARIMSIMIRILEISSDATNNLLLVKH